MPLREGHALCPEAVFLIPDEGRYKQAFEKVLEVLDTFSPVVQVVEPGCAYIDVTGVESEQELACELTSTVFRDAGLKASIGITTGKFFSLMAALTTKSEIQTIVLAGDEVKFIMPFSIDFLNCKPEVKERLRLLGINFIGQLRGFTKEALFAQFGDDGLRVYHLAHGVDSSLLIPRKREDIITVSAYLEAPVTQETKLLQTCHAIVEEPFQKMRALGKVCREVQIQLSFDTGNSEDKRLTLKEKTSLVKVVLDRIRVWLESGAFSAPVTQVTLSLWLTNDEGKRPSFWSEETEKKQRISHLAGELKKNFGYQPLKKAQEIDPDTIVPERRFGLTDIQD